MNHYRRIERFFYNKKNKTGFVVLELSLLILIFSLIFNGKYVIIQFIAKANKRIKSKKHIN